MERSGMSRRTISVLLVSVLLVHQTVHEWHQLSCDISRSKSSWIVPGSSILATTSSTDIPHARRVPMQPLRPECLEIVQKAKPVNLSYVNVTDISPSHPHMGAVDANGTLGYVHDVTAITRNPPHSTFPI